MPKDSAGKKISRPRILSSRPARLGAVAPNAMRIAHPATQRGATRHGTAHGRRLAEQPQGQGGDRASWTSGPSSCITISPGAACARQNISRSTRTAWSRRSSTGRSSSGNRTPSCNISRTRRAATPSSRAIPQGRADVVRWQCWELVHFNRAFGTLAFETVAKPQLNFGPADASARRHGAGRSRAVRAGAGRASRRPPVCGGRRNHDRGLFAAHLRGLPRQGAVRLGALPAASTPISTVCGRSMRGCGLPPRNPLPTIARRRLPDLQRRWPSSSRRERREEPAAASVALPLRQHRLAEAPAIG